MARGTERSLRSLARCRERLAALTAVPFARYRCSFYLISDVLTLFFPIFSPCRSFVNEHLSDVDIFEVTPSELFSGLRFVRSGRYIPLIITPSS